MVKVDLAPLFAFSLYWQERLVMPCAVYAEGVVVDGEWPGADGGVGEAGVGPVFRSAKWSRSKRWTKL